MAAWKIAGVQMDCRFADKDRNLEVVRKHLVEAADQNARLVIFPECALTGYCFTSKEEAWPYADTIPGPTTRILSRPAEISRLHVCVVLSENSARGHRDRT
jgi:predicted amidohydrolase